MIVFLDAMLFQLQMYEHGIRPVDLFEELKNNGHKIEGLHGWNTLQKLKKDGFTENVPGWPDRYIITYDGRMALDQARQSDTTPYKLMEKRKTAAYWSNIAKTSVVGMNAIFIVAISIIAVYFQQQDVAIQKEMLEIQKQTLDLQKKDITKQPIINIVIDSTVVKAP